MKYYFLTKNRLVFQEYGEAHAPKTQISEKLMNGGDQKIR